MTTDIVVPQMGESVVEATVGEWLVSEGDRVQVGDPLVSLETDKVDVEVGADAGGVIGRIDKERGEDVAVGDVLGTIDEDGAAPAEEEGEDAVEAEETAVKEATTETDEEEPAPEREADEAEPERATPVARRMAEAQGVDLAQISGSGPGGKVTKQDVVDYLETAEAEVEPEEEKPERKAARTAPAEEEAAERPRAAQETRERMSRRRRTIASRLVEAQQNAAILTTFNEIDMSAVIDLRRRRRDAFQEKHGVKLGFTSFFVKAVIGALKAFPRLNAEIEGNDMIMKHYYDIGIAVGVEEGLVVPVVRDADHKSFAEIEDAVRDFAQRARDGELTLDELMGGTFTITNGGVFGSMLSTPILNPPQVGILGLHNIVERPVAVDGEMEIRPIMYVALSYDHRIVDGREAVQFLVRVKQLIEDPEELLLAG
jgi:2-oxoglutarate dehydrogenase E2 component (dihydrolipoamide succinyltransferase)